MCFIIARGKLQYFARLSEILLIIFTITLILSASLTIPEIDFKNFLPATTYDISQVFKMQQPIVGTISYIFIMFFMGSTLPSSKEIKEYGIKAAIAMTLIGLASIFVTIGIFGAEVTQNLNLPFSLAMREINILERIYGLESIFISLWLLSDVTIVVASIYVIKNMISKVTNTPENKEYVTPIIFLSYILSLWIVNNRHEYEFFVKEVILNLNIIIGFVLPLLILIIGKIRKKL